MKNNKNLPPEIPNLSETEEIFVEGFQGVSVRNAVAKINFYTSHQKDDGKKEERTGAVILVTSLADLIGITEGLNNVIKEIEKTGIITRVETKPEPGKD